MNLTALKMLVSGVIYLHRFQAVRIQLHRVHDRQRSAGQQCHCYFCGEVEGRPNEHKVKEIRDQTKRNLVDRNVEYKSLLWRLYDLVFKLGALVDNKNLHDSKWPSLEAVIKRVLSDLNKLLAANVLGSESSHIDWSACSPHASDFLMQFCKISIGKTNQVENLGKLQNKWQITRYEFDQSGKWALVAQDYRWHSEDVVQH